MRESSETQLSGAVTIRAADPSRDAAACARIYAPQVERSAISFEERAPGSEEMAERIERAVARYQWLVAEREGELVGYAYAGSHRERPVYRWSVDVSVYVVDGERGSGIGRALYAELFEHLRRRRYRIACAGITLPNAASVALHERLGFVLVGVNRAIGWKHGAWRDVGLYQLNLLPPEDEPPPEPLPPS